MEAKVSENVTIVPCRGASDICRSRCDFRGQGLVQGNVQAGVAQRI
jgi:hypothetical protein